MIDTLVEKYGKKYGISSRELSLQEKVFKAAEHQKKLSQLIGTELKNILGVEVVSNATILLENPTFWQKAFASPRHTANVILYIVFGWGKGF